MGNGHNNKLWEDIWLGETSLANQYSSLYNTVQPNNVSLHCAFTKSSKHWF
jgi:hypothetical protein